MTKATLKTKKELILEVSLSLFSEKGFNPTSVRDIAKEVGITQSGLYNHFKGKDAILEALIADLMTSAVVTIFENKSIDELANSGKTVLRSIATTFKLISFDKKNEALFKLLMQELYKNAAIRDIYNEHFYQANVKKLSSIFFLMMQNETIKHADPLFLAHEFFSPLFFYQMQVNLLKIDKKSNSSMVTLFEKHVDSFWENNKVVKEEALF
jgi:AcrR family transcriptional regulator